MYAGSLGGQKEVGVFGVLNEGQHPAIFRAIQISKHLWSTKYIQGHGPLLFGLPRPFPPFSGNCAFFLPACDEWLP